MMKCNKDCPAWGETHYENTGKSYCFCIGKPTTEVKPDTDCRYGIEDYTARVHEIWNKE